jgi:hypothetical protein
MQQLLRISPKKLVFDMAQSDTPTSGFKVHFPAAHIVLRVSRASSKHASATWDISPTHCLLDPDGCAQFSITLAKLGNEKEHRDQEFAVQFFVVREVHETPLTAEETWTRIAKTKELVDGHVKIPFRIENAPEAKEEEEASSLPPPASSSSSSSSSSSCCVIC